MSAISWTAPRTWVALEALTASLFNVHLRDNLLDLNARTVDTGWITTGFTASSGFTISACRYRMVGGFIVSVSVDMNLTGSDIAASSAGNITDTPMVTIPGALKPTTTLYTDFQAGGVVDGSANIDSATGVVTLQSLSSNGTITTGTLVHLDVMYMI